MELGHMAEVSARHMSFVETGRARPSRKLVLRLAETLDISARERNALLLAAGYAPVAERPSAAEARTYTVGDAVRRMLSGHEPYPALAYDEDLNIVDTNESLVNLLTDLVAPELMQPTMSVVRLGLDADGLAAHVLNLAEWREEELAELRARAMLGGSDQLRSLYGEFGGCGHAGRARAESGPPGAGGSLRLRALGTELRFFGATTEFAGGDAAGGLSVATFHPGDSRTAAALHHIRVAG
jgi:DNA-binding XRE family transcriptional regulator